MLYNFSCWQARTARKRFENPEGDHLTLINVYRASDQFLENRSGLSRENHEEKFHKWCKKYFIDSCSLRRAREIHRLPINIPCVVYMFLLISHKISCCNPALRKICMSIHGVHDTELALLNLMSVFLQPNSRRC